MIYEQLIQPLQKKINHLTEINKRYDRTTNGIRIIERTAEKPNEVSQRTRPEK